MDSSPVSQANLEVLYNPAELFQAGEHNLVMVNQAAALYSLDLNQEVVLCLA